MSKISTPIVLVLGALLLVGCAGDDTVNPLPPPDASTSDASKDAAASAHDASDAKAGETPEAGEKDATSDAGTEGGTSDAGDASTVDASSPDSGNPGPDAQTDASPDAG